jgi:Glycosyl transferase family 8
MPNPDQINYPSRSAITDKSRCNVRNADEVDGICRNLNGVVEEVISTEGLFAGEAPRHAFLTFATAEYNWGVIAWLRSLRMVSDKPVFLLVTREMRVPKDIKGVYVIIVPALYDDQALFRRSEFQHVLSKLWIFALSTLDRIFFADADCLFLKSCDELFERADFLVCPDYFVSRKEDNFNTGVMVFNPNETLRRRVFRRIADVSSEDGGDQGYLNPILRDEVVFIDEKYNLLRHFHYFSNGSSNSDIHIIHFIVKKPWVLQYTEIADAMLVDLDDLWTSFLSTDERSQLIAEWRRSIFHISERRRFETGGFPIPLDLERRLRARLRRLWIAALIETAALLILIGFELSHFWR